jgi:uncharacterized damage-inducible protein DinB
MATGSPSTGSFGLAANTVHGVTDEDIGFPTGHDDERELLVAWLRYLRGAVARKLDGVDETQARWQPDGRLISLLGIVVHLTRVEWRWIDGGFGGADVRRNEEEFHPGADVTVASVLDDYRRRAEATDAAVRSLGLSRRSDAESWAKGHDLRFVVLHLINETARHAGHADATRELLDGTTGE